MISCANCGAENDSDAVFCAACNHFLQWDEPAPAPRERRGRRSSGDLAAALGSLGDGTQPEPSEAQPGPIEGPTVSEQEPAPRQARDTSGEPARGRSGEPAPGTSGEPARGTSGEQARGTSGDQARGTVRPGDPGASVQEIIAAIDAGREIAASQGRTDLDQHLHETKQRLATEQVQVVFCGQFKVGKSTMINALLQRAVCPVDADVVTAVPTIVRYAPEPTVTTYVRTDDEDRVEERRRPLEEIDLLVTEEADPSDPERDRVVEVGLPHRMLRSGLALVDTPGVGGLDSAHGFLTLGALRFARGVVFVTDAAQELTAPELSFLQTAVERCPTTAVVVTKIDLYPHWRRIVELDRQHLANAGLDLPLIAVSSFLRLRAAQSPELNAESGFADLVTFLARDVVAASRQQSAKTAAVEVEFVASQLEQQSAAERAVIEAPESTEEVVAELDRVQEQAQTADPPDGDLADHTVRRHPGPRLRHRARPAATAARGDPRRRGGDRFRRPEGHLGRHRGLAASADRHRHDGQPRSAGRAGRGSGRGRRGSLPAAEGDEAGPAGRAHVRRRLGRARTRLVARHAGRQAGAAAVRGAGPG